MKKNDTIQLVGGARLATGGLHLGHWFGNIVPRLDFPEDTEYWFVVKDTEPLIWDDPKAKQNALLDICSDVLSVPFSSSLRITTASAIISCCYNLYCHVLDHVTFNGLISAHFNKKAFRGNDDSPSLKNFLFPIDEAVVLLALQANYLVSNDDNQRMICFSRDLTRRINRTSPSLNFPIPELHHNKQAGRLLGFDYRRMCKAHNNTIGLTQDIDTLRASVRKVISMRTFFTKYPDELEKYKNSAHKYFFPDHYLPFIYLRHLANHMLQPADLTLLSIPENQVKLEDLLLNKLDLLISPFRRRKTELLQSPDIIYARLAEDAVRAREIIFTSEQAF